MNQLAGRCWSYSSHSAKCLGRVASHGSGQAVEASVLLIPRPLPVPWLKGPPRCLPTVPTRLLAQAHQGHDAMWGRWHQHLLR